MIKAITDTQVSDEFFDRLQRAVYDAIIQASEYTPHEEEPVLEGQPLVHDDLRDAVSAAMARSTGSGELTKKKIRSLFNEIGASVVTDVPANQIEEMCEKIGAL